jgi:halogenation protein CepH
MRYFVERCPRIAELLASGTRISTGVYGSYRIRKDYSYANSAFWVPGLVLIGDAACFIDPVFSSGVHLATYSGLLAARSILTCLSGRLGEAECFDEFERRYRQEFAVFYEFLLGFYDMHQDEESYFWKARKVLRNQDRDNAAFIQLVAGTGTTADDFFNLRRDSGEMLQLLVDSVADPQDGTRRRQERLDTLPADARQVAERAASAPNEVGRSLIAQALPERFHAVREALAGPEPVATGIVPSRDGFYWERR